MKIIVFGNGNAGINVVQGIIGSCQRKDVEIIYVYKYGYAIDWAGVRTKRFSDESDDEMDIFVKERGDLVISSGWHKRMPDELILNFECFNIHPSLLPKYRGILPIEFQLHFREKESGITIHRMDRRFDAGPICMQRAFSIEKIETVNEFVVSACRVTRKMIAEFIDNYPYYEAVAQNETEATYFGEKDRVKLKKRWPD